MAIRSNGSIQATAAGASFPPKTVPGLIATITVATTSTTAATITWAAPANVGSGSITGYTLDRSTNGSSWTNILTNSNVTTTSATGLTNGTTYYWRVAAVNEVGTGSFNQAVALHKFGLGTFTTQDYTSGATWTCPAGVTSANVTVVGGGAAGSSAAGGGGARPRYYENIAVTPGVGYSIVIGAGATQGSSSDGGTTSFATNYTSAGGSYSNSGIHMVGNDVGPIAGATLGFLGWRQGTTIPMDTMGIGWRTSGGGGRGTATSGSETWVQVGTGGSNSGAGGLNYIAGQTSAPGYAASGNGNGGGGGSPGGAGTGGLVRITYYV
jgi:hypothetical protein